MKLHLLDWWFKRKAKMLDDEWKEAISYAYKHYNGKELQDFIKRIEENDDKRAGKKV